MTPRPTPEPATPDQTLEPETQAEAHAASSQGAGSPQVALRVAPQRSVNHEDVDDIIGVAAELKNSAEEQLSVSDLKEVALELGIEPHFVTRAIEALEERRRTKAALEQQQAQRRRTIKIAVAVALALFLLIGGGTSLSLQSSLTEQLSVAEQKRAQVKNVLERQKKVERRVKELKPGPEKDAELAGAENRVRIERRRYDQAASKYNAKAGGVFASLCARLFGLPPRLPLSNEVNKW